MMMMKTTTPPPFIILLLLLQQIILIVTVDGTTTYYASWYCKRFPTDKSCKRTVPTKAPTKVPTSSPIVVRTKAPTSAPIGVPTNAQTSAPIGVPPPPPPTTSNSIPNIKCISTTVQPDSNQVTCPNIHELVAAAVGRILNTIVYENDWIEPTVTSIYPDTVKPITNTTTANTTNTLLPLFGECALGCDDDDDCAPGLYCSKERKAALRSKGYDTTMVNCAVATTTTNSYSGTNGICFRKELLDPAVRQRKLRTSSSSSSSSKSRQLCGTKCSSQCRTNPNAPACLFLGCSSCRRRRRLDGNEDDIDVDELVTTATAKLRELASMQNYTSLDSINCKNFLLTATCFATDEED